MRILTCATLIGAVLFVASCGPASPPPAPVVYTHPFKYRNSYDRFKDSTTVVLEIAPIRVNTEKGDYPFNTAFRLTTGHAGQTARISSHSNERCTRRSIGSSTVNGWLGPPRK